jgi:hypothetical protein
MTEIISPELEYKPMVNNHSTVIYRKVSPQGANSVTLSTASSVGPTEIVIAPSVFSMGRSRLNFTLNIAAQAAGKATWIDANILTALARVVVYDSATNAVLSDISNFEKYATLITPASTSFPEYMTKACSSNATSQVISTYTATNGLEDIGKCNSLLNYTREGTTLSDAAGTNSYLSRRQLYVSAVATAVAVSFSIPFSAIAHSFLALEKNVYSPSNLVLQLYWNATDNFAWFSDAVGTPQTGSLSLTGAITVSSIALQLANEGNLNIVSETIKQVMSSGISIPIAYPTVTRQTLTGGAHSFQLQLTKGYGQRILALISAPFNVGATVNVRNEHKRSTLTTYNTFLNNVALRYPNGYDCTLSDDYFFANRPFIHGSSVQTIGEYVSAEWLHCDTWFGDKGLWELDQTKIDGLDVGIQSSTWSIQANNSGTTSFIWIAVILGQKVATFTSGGVMVQ